MSRKKILFIVISILVLAGLACNMGGSSSTKSTEEDNSPSSKAKPTKVPTKTQVPTPTPIPSSPIGLRQGLSSLNSYQLTIRAVSNGPTAVDKSVITSQSDKGSDGESTHVHYETISSSAEYPDEDISTSDQYEVGGRTCSFSSGDEEVETAETDPFVQEMSDTWFEMIDLVPMVNDPVFVGAEEMNGVMTNHFTFTVSGLGDESGAEVVASTGEYWLAQDGQYIVKYLVVMETRDGPAGDPNTRTLHSEFYIEVQNINQEVVITLPPVCQ
jgi:hypothetical protein